MRRVLPAIILATLLPIHILGLRTVTLEQKALPKGEDAAYVIPSSVLKITSLEFDGLASDFMFLRSIVFFGSILEKGKLSEVKQSEWNWLYKTLTASTDLDPYFLDPYYFGQAQLTWGPNMIKETNTLLEKGSDHRDWDWKLPFFIGFNHFYFLQENDRASDYLMEASKRPLASPLLATLATRLAYKGRRTENAIIFIEEMLKREEEEWIIEEYKTRLEALKRILYLEKAVALYNDKFKQAPSSVRDLIVTGVIKQLPVDPYGGEFYIDTDGSIKTTSELRPMKKEG